MRARICYEVKVIGSKVKVTRFGENIVLALDHEPFVGLTSNLIYMFSIYCHQCAVSRSRSSDDVSRSNSSMSNQQAFLVITQILLVGLKPNLV